MSGFKQEMKEYKGTLEFLYFFLIIVLSIQALNSSLEIKPFIYLSLIIGPSFL